MRAFFNIAPARFCADCEEFSAGPLCPYCAEPHAVVTPQHNFARMVAAAAPLGFVREPHTGLIHLDEPARRVA